MINFKFGWDYPFITFILNGTLWGAQISLK
jgi:hypothetical protein